MKVALFNAIVILSVVNVASKCDHMKISIYTTRLVDKNRQTVIVITSGLAAFAVQETKVDFGQPKVYRALFRGPVL